MLVTSVDSGSPEFISLQLNGDKPVISYFDPSFNLKLATCTANCATATPTWQIVTVDSGSNPNGNGPPSLQLNNGNPVIAYSYGTGLKLATCTANCASATPTWQIVFVSNNPTASAFVSLQLDSGNPVISFGGQISTTRGLYLATCTANCASATPTWQVVNVDTTTPDQVMYTSLQLNGGNPVISYQKSGNNGLKLATCTANCASGAPTWQVVTVDNSVASIGQFTSLQLNGGNPVISYYDLIGKSLKLATCTANCASGAPTWQIVAVDGGSAPTDAGEFNSLQLSNGNPVISYAGHLVLKLATCTANCASASPTWQIATVFNGALVAFSSLQLDAGSAIIGFFESASTTVELAIVPAPTSVSVAAGPTVVVGSGTPMTASAVLTGGFLATGTITFTLKDPNSVVVDTETVTVNGDGTYATPTGFIPSVAGTYSWAAAYSGDGLNNSATAAPPASALVTTSADFNVVMTPASQTVSAGSNVTFTLNVTNNGPSDAQSVTISDTLPVGFAFVSNNQSAGPSFACTNGSTTTCSIATLPAGATATFTLVANVGVGLGPFTNTATVSSTTSHSPASINASSSGVTVNPLSDLVVTMSAPATILAGNTLTYSLTLTNNGPSDAQTVSLADLLPSSLAFVSQAQSAGPALTLSNAGNSVSDTIATLPAGSSAVLTIVTTVNSNVAVGTVVSNTASASTSTPESSTTNNSSTATTSVVPVTTFSGPSSTGTGTISASLSGGGSACALGTPQLLGAPPGANPIPSTAPAPGITFPQGLFALSATGCTVGSTVTVTLTYPQSIAGATYWKYGPTSGNPAPHWYPFPAVISGNTATLTITDGGLGDDDLIANGVISDPGGPAFGALTVPTLSEWMLALLGLVLMGLGIVQLSIPWKATTSG
ncbi:MAG TPA: DUF11 domain-containing protein [Usitatibacter sp.]|nr:DUF11 domain-containing protein [Usitatibacter sp.]